MAERRCSGSLPAPHPDAATSGHPIREGQREDPYEMDPDAEWSQGAYEAWLPDTIRQVFGVEGRAEQAARAEQMNEPRGPGR